MYIRNIGNMNTKRSIKVIGNVGNINTKRSIKVNNKPWKYQHKKEH